MEWYDIGPDDDDGQDQEQSSAYNITPEDSDPTDPADPKEAKDQ